MEIICLTHYILWSFVIIFICQSCCSFQLWPCTFWKFFKTFLAYLFILYTYGTQNALFILQQCFFSTVKTACDLPIASTYPYPYPHQHLLLKSPWNTFFLKIPRISWLVLRSKIPSRSWMPIQDKTSVPLFEKPNICGTAKVSLLCCFTQDVYTYYKTKSYWK